MTTDNTHFRTSIKRTARSKGMSSEFTATRHCSGVQLEYSGPQLRDDNDIQSYTPTQVRLHSHIVGDFTVSTLQCTSATEPSSKEPEPQSEAESTHLEQTSEARSDQCITFSATLEDSQIQCSLSHNYHDVHRVELIAKSSAGPDTKQ